MKKTVVSKLFLYRHRFTIGYTLLALAFSCLLFTLPLFAQNGLSNAEIESATNSYYLDQDTITKGDLIDLPYRTLQKVSITIFGLSNYSVKLPSMIIGVILGILLILLLNRWFKNNVSLLASWIMILSTPFLYLAGSGTPLIMLVFWPTLLLWLGSKIQGEKRPKPLYSIIFAIALLLAIFTPYMAYFAVLCVIFAISQPHLRFVIKSLPKLPFILTCLIAIAGLTMLTINIVNCPSTILELLFAKDFAIGDFWNNLATGFAPVFSWKNSLESVFLSPLISLPTFALILIGLFSTTKGFFASRNSIASLLIVFTVIITGFRPDAIIFFILPVSILIAHSLKYILEKWYNLFPENPYARISALFPLATLFAIILIPSLFQYIYGYHYNPSLANEFSDNLSIIRKNLTEETTLIVPQETADFYHLLEYSTPIKVVTTLDENSQPPRLASFKKQDNIPENYELKRIITSAKSDNSDIIYLYTAKGEQNGSDVRPNENDQPTS